MQTPFFFSSLPLPPPSNEIQISEPVFRLLVFKSEAPSLVFSHLSLASPSGFLIAV